MALKARRGAPIRRLAVAKLGFALAHPSLRACGRPRPNDANRMPRENAILAGR
jgi:hypothetical protein